MRSIELHENGRFKCSCSQCTRYSKVVPEHGTYIRWKVTASFETVTSNCESIRAPPAFITSVMKLFVAGLPAWLFLKRGLAAFICIPRSASVLRRAVSLWIFLLLILRDVQNFMAQAGVGKKTSSNHCLSRRGKNKYSIKPHLMKRGNDSRATVCITAW